MIAEFFQSLVTTIGEHPQTAFVIVFLIAAGEALFIVGLFVPSTLVLVGAGTLVGLGKLSFFPIFSATVLGAIVGDACSYWVGYTLKDRIREIWPFSRYTNLLDRGEVFFKKHGGKSIFIGRFIPGVKSVVPGVAGMVDMNLMRFTVINVLSSFVWAAAHLFPSMLIGRGINVVKISNPRLLILGLLSALIAICAWYLARFTFSYLMPYFEKIRLVAARALARRGTGTALWLSRLLANENGMLISSAYAAVTTLALAGFMLLFAKLLFDPELARSDTAISNYIQTLRNETFNQMMVAVTMLGDWIVLTAMAGILTAGLLLYREWKMGLSAAAVFVTAVLFVPVMKSFLHRARPTELYLGADSFSFPSGHATLSTTIFGITAVFIAHNLSGPWKHAIYLLTAVLIAMIGFSRVYLLAHWPSDVMAGMAFGAALIFALALPLHDRTLKIPTSAFAAAVVFGVGAVYSAHLYSTFPDARMLYAAKPNVVVLERQAWQAADWRTLPQERILLDGDAGEPLLAQTDRALADLIAGLKNRNWIEQPYTWSDEVIEALIPSRTAIRQRAPLPLTNNGAHPLVTLTKPDSSKTRTVLRIWKTEYVSKDAETARPILVLSATRERLGEIALNYSLVHAGPVDGAEAAALTREIAGIFGVAAETGKPLILSP